MNNWIELNWIESVDYLKCWYIKLLCLIFEVCSLFCWLSILFLQVGEVRILAGGKILWSLELQDGDETIDICLWGELTSIPVTLKVEASEYKNRRRLNSTTGMTINVCSGTLIWATHWPKGGARPHRGAGLGWLIARLLVWLGIHRKVK